MCREGQLRPIAHPPTRAMGRSLRRGPATHHQVVSGDGHSVVTREEACGTGDIFGLPVAVYRDRLVECSRDRRILGHHRWLVPGRRRRGRCRLRRVRRRVLDTRSRHHPSRHRTARCPATRRALGGRVGSNVKPVRGSGPVSRWAGTDGAALADSHQQRHIGTASRARPMRGRPATWQLHRVTGPLEAQRPPERPSRPVADRGAYRFRTR